MASYTLTSSRIPPGTTVKAYPKTNWPTPGQPKGAPQGASAAEGSMGSTGVALTGLTANAEYWAVAEVGGGYVYVGFTAASDTAQAANHATRSELNIVNLGTDWSAGDLIGVRVTSPPVAHKFDLRDGTAASPVKVGVSGSISRVDATTRAEVNAMGPEGTDGPDGATALRIGVKGLPANEVQITALSLRAWQTSTYGSVGNDATPLLAAARVSGSGTGRAIPAYFESVRETSTSRGQQGLEIRIRNSSGESDSFVGTAPSKSMGVWVNAEGANPSAAGFQIGHAFAQQFDVGYGANAESLISAFMHDESSALRSIRIRGTHSKAAISIASGAGIFVAGAEEKNFAGSQLFELYFGEEALDPGFVIGTDKGKSVSGILMRNSTGQAKVFASNAANAFLTGTAQGDTGINFTAGKVFHVGAQGKTSLLRVNETGVGFNGAAPVAKAGVIASPAAEVAALKTAVDAIRVALTNAGITA